MKGKLLAETQIMAYAGCLRSEEKAASTIANYLRDIHFFTNWLNGRPVTKEIVSGWKEHLLELKLAPTTINAKLSSLNSLFAFLGWNDCRVKSMKIQQRAFRDASRELTKEDYIRLLNAAKGLGRERLELMMETICATGIRVSELSYITVEAAINQQAIVNLKGKVRTIMLPPKLCRKLEKFARKNHISSGVIFRSKNGNPISRCQVWREMKALCKTAGIPPAKVFPHNLRHLFATAFYRACRDIVKLADLLGHSSVNTTRIYLKTTGAEHARYLEKLNLIL